MPKQSKRNQHLQKACETKKLKIIEPITDEYIDKEVFENESRLEIEELIYENIESDDDWRDLSLTTELESAFSKLIRISNKSDTLESKGRPLIYT
ncbi:11597_t:CDS:1, partial [Entrophospora sp. SA101]